MNYLALIVVVLVPLCHGLPEPNQAASIVAATEKDTPPGPVTNVQPTITPISPTTPSTTPSPVTTSSTTIKTTSITTPSSTSTAAPTTTTTTPPPSTTTKSSSTSTHAPTTAQPTQAPTTKAPAPAGRKFDGPSFVGGIVLTIGLTAIGLVGFKVYKSRKENYRTL